MKYRFLILSAICGVAQAAQQSVTFDGAHTASVTAPSTSTWASLNNYHVSTRFTYVDSGSSQYVFQLGNNMSLYIPGGTNQIAAVLPDTSTGVSSRSTITFAQVHDVRACIERNGTAGTFTIYTWSGDGSWGNLPSQGAQQVSQTAFSGTAQDWRGQGLGIAANFGGSFLANGGQIAFLRIDTGACPTTAPADDPVAQGNVADWRFAGNLNDTSGNSPAANLTWGPSGSPSYVSTTNYPCFATLNPYPSLNRAFRLGSTLALTAAASFCSRIDTGIPSSIAWSRTAGPGSATFTPTTGATSSLSISGQTAYRAEHDIQVAVGDGTATVNASQAEGCVKTDAYGNVDLSDLDARVPKLLADKLHIWGEAPGNAAYLYPWEAYLEMADADQMGPLFLSGANSITDGTQIGASGAYTVTNASPPHITSATSFTGSLTVGQQVFVSWDSIDGTNTGRAVGTVGAINSTTDFTLSVEFPGNSFPPVVTGQIASLPVAGVNLYAAKPEAGACTQTQTSDVCYQYSFVELSSGAGTVNFWYYDRPYSWYKLYYSTGIDIYKTYADAAVDQNWTYVLDHGAGNGASAIPRAMALHSQFIRAVTGSLTARLPALYKLVAYLSVPPFTPASNTTNYDRREGGYITGYMADFALTDSTDRAAACTYLTTNLPGWYNPAVQGGVGQGYREDLFAEGTYVGALPLGFSPWRQGAVALRALQRSYDAWIDPDGCNNPSPTIAANLLTSIGLAVQGTYDDGRSSTNRGMYYEVDYPTNISYPLATSSIPGAGSLTIVNGSTNVVGSSSLFITNPNGCPEWLGVLAPNRTAIDVVSVHDCATDTLLHLNSAWADSSVAGVGFYTTLNASTSCTAMSYCESGAGPPDGDRGLTRAPIGAFAWMFLRTHTAAYLTEGLELYSATFGGPADGPGGILACQGYGCDGQMAETASALRDGGYYPAPAGVQGSSPWVFNAMKDPIEGTGFPDAQLLMGVIAENSATAPTFTTTCPLPSGSLNVAYSTTVLADGTVPVTFTIASGSLPTGLSLATSGAITGTPTVAGTASFTILAANGISPDATLPTMGNCNLTIAPGVGGTISGGKVSFGGKSLH